MPFALWLISRYKRRIVLSRRRITQPFAEAASAKLLRAAKELDGVVHAKRCNYELHRPVVLIAQREQVRSHVIPSLAFGYRGSGF